MVKKKRSHETTMVVDQPARMNTTAFLPWFRIPFFCWELFCGADEWLCRHTFLSIYVLFTLAHQPVWTRLRSAFEDNVNKEKSPFRLKSCDPAASISLSWHAAWMADSAPPADFHSRWSDGPTSLNHTGCWGRNQPVTKQEAWLQSWRQTRCAPLAAAEKP